MMQTDRIISLEQLKDYGRVTDLNSQALLLVKQQLDTWELAGRNYAASSGVQKRHFRIGHERVEVHHNPGRIRSSAAKTDAKSIASRPCFLCKENLPDHQKGIAFGDSFIVLTNPFPIFSNHLTIAHTSHLPQVLGPYFGDMLQLSRELYGFTVFYNGPQCGASAPDHFHFQAGSRGEMPIEAELDLLKTKYARKVTTTTGIGIYAVENGLRRFILLESSVRELLEEAFSLLYGPTTVGTDDEPMLNLLSLFEDGRWKVILFPRKQQRPSHYYQTGEMHVLVSPAAVEMGGLLILPRHEDFMKLDVGTISAVYDEVTASQETLNGMLSVLSRLSG